MIQLHRGDRCRLINAVELDRSGIKRLHGKEVVLIGEQISGGWDFYCVTDPEAARWWAPDMCFQLEQQNKERKKTNEMNAGDRCQLYDLDKLRKANLPESTLGKYVILDRTHVYGGTTGSGWYFHFENDLGRRQWWAPEECLALMSHAVVAKSHYKKGDRCRLIDMEALRSISMGDHVDKIVTLDKQLTSDEKQGRGILMDKYKHDEVWWVRIDTLGRESLPYYVPVKCLLLIDQQLTSGDYQLLEKLTETTTKKETDSMYLYTVAIIQTPSHLAQQAGEIDKLIVPSTEVMAAEANSAIAVVSAKNAEAILAAAEKSTIRIVVKQQG